MSLRLFNNLLSVVVGLLAFYIIVAPLLPQLSWWLEHDSPVRAIVNPPDSVQTSPIDLDVADDKLFIPRLNLEETIHGNGIASLRKGVWRLPHTAMPGEADNTVLVGHRYTYRGQSVFYHLDKVRKGDQIVVHWQGQIYEYRVAEIKVVPPTKLSVEAPTQDARLTIYTCTPLWNAKNRLVVIAKPVEVN